MSNPIPGYTHGTASVPRAPMSLAEFALVQRTALFAEEDVAHLRMSKPVLADQTDAILDVWYGFVGANPHLLESFTRTSDHAPDPDYLARVRQRFGRWILDTADANYDQAWLDYQFEIGRRHHRIGKNRTDGVESTPLVLLRYLLPLVVPITATLRPFLASKGHSPAEVDGMAAAWLKSVLVQVTLWTHPYVLDGDF